MRLLEIVNTEWWKGSVLHKCATHSLKQITNVNVCC